MSVCKIFISKLPIYFFSSFILSHIDTNIFQIICIYLIFSFITVFHLFLCCSHFTYNLIFNLIYFLFFIFLLFIICLFFHSPLNIIINNIYFHFPNNLFITSSVNFFKFLFNFFFILF